MAKKSLAGNYRSTKHALLLYPSDPRYAEQMDRITAYNHVFIQHDKDLDSEGNPKKAHVHCIIVTKNATWRNALSSEIGLAPNYFEQVRNFDCVLEYLVHANEEKKHRYSLDELKGCPGLVRRVKDLVEKDELSESDKVAELIEMIMGYEGYLTFREFSWYCAKNGRWDVFRRSGSIFLEIIREKNKGV